MKIGSQRPVPPATLETATTTTGASSRVDGATVRSPAGGPTAPQDTVTLSSEGSRVSALASSPDFDEKKVEAIRQAIREGRFSVNAEAIADRLISEATALVGGRAH